MKKHLFPIIAFLFVVLGSVQSFADDKYIRISNVSMLHDGDEVIVVSGKYGVAMSKFQTKKHMAPCNIDIAADSLTASVFNDSVAVFKLNQYSGKWRLYNEEKGWLYASSKNNGDLLFTKDKNTKTGSSILVDLTFDDYANAFVTFGVSDYENLRYTHNSLYFARYRNKYSCDHIQLYRRLKNPNIIDNVRFNDRDDNASFLADNEDAFVSNVVVERTFRADGGYYTLCLPFDITECDIREVFGGAQFKLLQSVERVGDDKIVLHFLTSRQVSAGTPCIVRLRQDGGDIVNPTFGSKFILATEPTTLDFKASKFSVSMVGTYSPVVLPADGRYRFMSAGGGKLVTPNREGELDGFRAYFLLSEPIANADFDSAGKSLSIAIDMGEESFPDGALTNMATITTRPSSADTPIYTITGQLVDAENAMRPGIYIRGGKKIIVR